MNDRPNDIMRIARILEKQYPLIKWGRRKIPEQYPPPIIKLQTFPLLWFQNYIIKHKGVFDLSIEKD